MKCKYIEICEKKNHCTGWCNTDWSTDKCEFRPDRVIDRQERELNFLRSSFIDRVIGAVENLHDAVG